MERLDVVVVGAGIMGSASAWELARRGRSVVVLEQFEPAHVRGSSHGGSRIYRLAYPEPFWIDFVLAAREGWRELEAESGGELLVETGSVDHGDRAGVRPIQDALTAVGAAYEMLDPEEADQRWPGIRFDGAVCHQPEGGRLNSARALRAFTDQSERLGGVTRWNTPVRALERAGEGVRVVTDGETYEANVAVIAAGAWIEPLLAGHVPMPQLVVTQESAFHFASREPVPWPSFIHHGAIARYGLETPGEGVKVAEHHAGPEVTADGRDFLVDRAARDRVVEFVEAWLPGLSPEPVSEVTCLYTNTATEDFVLDRVGPFVVVSPCSGHGFKFAPVIGRLVADLASGTAPLERFALRPIR